MNYGERLEQAIKLAQSSRAKVAAATGISVQAIGQVITGKTVALTAENSARAAKELKVDHHWLATGEGEPRSQKSSLFSPEMMQRLASLDSAARHKCENILRVHLDMSQLPDIQKHSQRKSA